MILEEVYINTLITHKLTQQQLLALILVYKKRDDLILKYNKNYYIKETMLDDYFTKDLVSRGYLKAIYKKVKSKTNPNEFVKTFDRYEIGEMFYTIIIENPLIIIDELFDAYPTFCNINGVHMPLTAFSRTAATKMYMENIMYSVDEHLTILEDIKFGKQQGIINMKIDKFIESKFYLSIRESRLKDEHFINNQTDYDEL